MGNNENRVEKKPKDPFSGKGKFIEKWSLVAEI